MARSPFRKAGRSIERGLEIGATQALVGIAIIVGSALVWGAWNWLTSE